MNNQAFSVARSLKRKLLLPLLLVGAALAAATIWGIYAKSQKLLAEKLRLRAELLASAVIYAAESVSRPGELQRIVTAIGAEEVVSLIVVVGGRPARVLAATRTAWLGQALTALPVKAVAEDLAEAIQTRQSHSHLHLDMARVEVTSPLLLSRPELADQSLTGGAVMVHLDLRPTQAAMRQLTLELSTAFLAALAILAALGYGLVHHLVLRPIARIGTLVEHRPAGAGESWAEAATDDELGALARTLNDSLTRTDAMLHELEDQKNALCASETKFRILVENIPQKLFIKDRNSRWVSVNENFARGLGRRPEEVMGKGDSDFFPKELAGKYRADDQRIMRTGRTEELEEKHLQDGREIWVHTVKAPVRDERGEITGVFCIFWDITESKRTAEALRASEERFRQLAETMPDSVLVGQDGRIVYANSAAARLLGTAGPEGLLGLDIFAVIEPAQHERSRRQMQRALAGEKLPPFEDRFVRFDGSLVTVEIAVSLLTWQDRPALQVVVRDITERKRAEEALRESRQLLRQILDAIPVRVFWKDLNFKYLGCNLPFALDSGLQSPEEMIGRDDLEMRWKTHAELYRADDRRVILSGQPKLGYEEPQTKPDGSGLLWLRTSKVPLRDADGRVTGVLGIYEDITERKQAEAERERLIVELQSALAHIKTLSGLIPICSGCKKIRDDKNYWHQVDTYIAEHTSAQFTHGLCPECVKKYFPDL